MYISSLCLCGSTGRLHYLQEGGECVERGKIEGQPLFLRIHNPRQMLAIVTHEMMLRQYSIDIKGETTQLMNVRYWSLFYRLISMCSSCTCTCILLHVYLTPLAG